MSAVFHMEPVDMSEHVFMNLHYLHTCTYTCTYLHMHVVTCTLIHMYITSCTFVFDIYCSVGLILHGGSGVTYLQNRRRDGSCSLQPPEKFNFKSPDDWPRWKKRFEQFRIASGLGKEDDERQAYTLLYCLGEEAEDVLLLTGITSEERKKYDTVLSKFDDYFKVRKNVIYDRARFNRRSQQPGESAEDYISALYNLAENCEYGTMREEMIRDRLVVGIRDDALSERLQLNAKLTLEEAKVKIRQKEAVHEQNETLKGADKANPIVLDSMQRSRADRQPAANSYRRFPANRSMENKMKTVVTGDVHVVGEAHTLGIDAQQKQPLVIHAKRKATSVLCAVPDQATPLRWMT